MIVALEKQIRSAAEILELRDKKIISEALDLAIQVHKGHKRRSGEDYIIHPLQVATDLWEKYQDPILTAAGLLHDTIEDCDDLEAADIYDNFGDEAGFLVEAGTKKSGGEVYTKFYDKSYPVFTDKIERLLWAGMRDVRVLILKLADRENNLSTISELPENRQIRMTFETQAIFQPLKSILKLDKPLQNAIDIQKHLDEFLSREEIVEASDFKEYLYNQSYQNFTQNIYNLVYDGTDKIIWEINNKDYYKQLCSNKDFDYSHKLISLWTDCQNFQVKFFLKRGYSSINNSKAKFKISTLRKIT